MLHAYYMSVFCRDTGQAGGIDHCWISRNYNYRVGPTVSCVIFPASFPSLPPSIYPSIYRSMHPFIHSTTDHLSFLLFLESQDSPWQVGKEGEPVGVKVVPFSLINPKYHTPFPRELRKLRLIDWKHTTASAVLCGIVSESKDQRSGNTSAKWHN